MGFNRNHAIIVNGWDEQCVRTAHRKAKQCFAFHRRLVSPVITGAVNGHTAFFIAPDGSKEGWEHSNLGDEARTAFVLWLRENWSLYLSWMEVVCGGDDDQAYYITRNASDDENDERFDA